MRLATIRRTDGTTRAVAVDGTEYADTGFADVGALLAEPDWKLLVETAIVGAARYAADDVQLAPVIPAPGKIICVGLNYRHHILEMGRELPTHPTLFAKYPEALIGPHDDLAIPPETDALDWEAELAIVIGRAVRRADEASAADAIAGFSVLNDVTERDWQYRTTQWMQGKTFEATTPFGPTLVTPDEVPGGVRPSLRLTCSVDDEQVQTASTADLVFDPVELVRYISTILTLHPGDVIATGTPGGVGHARTPPRALEHGQILVTEIEHIGQLRNRVVGP